MTLDLEKYLDMIGADDNIYNRESYEETMEQLDRHLLEVNTFQAVDKEMWITPRPKTLCYRKKHQVKFRLLHSTEDEEDVPRVAEDYARDREVSAHDTGDDVGNDAKQ